MTRGGILYPRTSERNMIWTPTLVTFPKIYFRTFWRKKIFAGSSAWPHAGVRRWKLVKIGILKKLSNTLVRYIVGKLSINVANWWKKSDHFWRSYGQFMAARGFTRTMTSWYSPRQCLRRRRWMFTIFVLQTHLGVRKLYTKNGLHITFFMENNKRGSNWPPPPVFSSSKKPSPGRVKVEQAS